MTESVGAGVHTEQVIANPLPGTTDFAQLSAGSQAPAL